MEVEAISTTPHTVSKSNKLLLYPIQSLPSPSFSLCILKFYWTIFPHIIPSELSNGFFFGYLLEIPAASQPTYQDQPGILWTLNEHSSHSYLFITKWYLLLYAGWLWQVLERTSGFKSLSAGGLAKNGLHVARRNNLRVSCAVSLAFSFAVQTIYWCHYLMFLCCIA